MHEEVFGPICPVKEYTDLDEPINWILDHPKPLSLYYFGTKQSTFNLINKKTSSGVFM
jgi:acyl-CoA reductase-like NAD-dependent aldehyde dehydrogenase